jgi:hypothetical protein
MRGAWMWVKGQATFGTTLYRGAQKMLFDAMSADSHRANGADMKRYLERMTSRYVPPGIDVDVTCFIAEKELTSKPIPASGISSRERSTQ